MTDLDQQLLAAHDAGDTVELIKLYSLAADTTKDATAASFYLTHAYVFALEFGHPDAIHLRARLVAEGREPPE